MKRYYLTTAIPYVNGKPHLGHALEFVLADVMARFQKLEGVESFLTSGADENALKNQQAARSAGETVESYIARHSQAFQDFAALLGVNLGRFQRSSDPVSHFPAVHALWNASQRKGDIYSKAYTGWYCVGCEAFVLEKDLVDGKCPYHDKVPEEVAETNYFFSLSKYADKLYQLIESDQFKITPERAKAEALRFIGEGLEDFSISRSKERAGAIGVPVPNDESQVVYVWFDALTVYLSAIGYPDNRELFESWWPASAHLIGKDILRFHAVYWPAMLLSAGLELPKHLVVHGFITSGGRKMSKSLGNVIDPELALDRYGTEATRFLLASQVPTLDDGDLTLANLDAGYTAYLSNGLGNLVSRVARLGEGIDGAWHHSTAPELPDEVIGYYQSWQFDQVGAWVTSQIRSADAEIERTKPWTLSPEELPPVLSVLVARIRLIALVLAPIMPETSARIESHFQGENFGRIQPLFPRLSA